MYAMSGMPAGVQVKVVLLGATASGKTCLVARYLNDRFDDTTITIGAAFGAKEVVVPAGVGSSKEEQTVTLGIWDTAGSERFEAMSRGYYRNAATALVCWDLTSALSFEKARKWVKEIRSFEPNCYVYLVGTKLDIVREEGVSSDEEDEVNSALERGVSRGEVDEFAEKSSVQFVKETSSLSGAGVKELFQQVTEDWVKRDDKATSERDGGRVMLGEDVDNGDSRKRGDNACAC